MIHSIDRLNTVDWFSDFLWKDPRSSFERYSSSYKDTDDGLELSVDLPGVVKEDIKVTNEGNVLLIESKRGEVSSRKSYSFSKEHDLSAATAKLELGVLKIHVPKKRRAPPNVIVVE